MYLWWLKFFRSLRPYLIFFFSYKYILLTFLLTIIWDDVKSLVHIFWISLLKALLSTYLNDNFLITMYSVMTFLASSLQNCTETNFASLLFSPSLMINILWVLDQVSSSSSTYKWHFRFILPPYIDILNWALGLLFRVP